MAYTPKTWTCGDTISADDLNRIEQALANSGGGTPLVVHDNEGTLDHTWQEIYDAMPNVMYEGEFDGMYIKSNAVFVHNLGDVYTVEFYETSQNFTTPDPNEHPFYRG